MRRKNRLEAIKRANELLYEQTDKMKNFRSQQLYCDVIETRKEQMETKKKVKEMEKEEAAKYHEVILKKVHDGDAEDVVKAQKIQEQLKVVAISRAQQLEEVRKQREIEREEERQIGLAIKKRAAEAVEADIVAYNEKQARAHASNLAMIAANEKIKQEKDIIREQEERAVEAREREIEISSKRTLARKALEKRRFEKKQVSRQKIIDAAVEALAAKTSNENAIQMKQEAELQEKEDKKFADKAAKREKEWTEIVESRTAMVAARKEARKKEYQEYRVLAERAKKEALDGLKEEKNKAQKAREMTIMIKQMQLEQGIETNRNKINAKVRQLEEDKALAALANQDDDKFTEIVRETIKDYSAKGKTIIPLTRALELSQADLLPAIKNPENNIKNRKPED